MSEQYRYWLWQPIKIKKYPVVPALPNTGEYWAYPYPNSNIVLTLDRPSVRRFSQVSAPGLGGHRPRAEFAVAGAGRPAWTPPAPASRTPWATEPATRRRRPSPTAGCRCAPPRHAPASAQRRWPRPSGSRPAQAARPEAATTASSTGPASRRRRRSCFRCSHRRCRPRRPAGPGCDSVVRPGSRVGHQPDMAATSNTAGPRWSPAASRNHKPTIAAQSPRDSTNNTGIVVFVNEN